MRSNNYNNAHSSKGEGLPHNVKLANEFRAFEKVVCEFAWELDELEEERKWFMEAMQAQIIDVVKRMKEITLVMQTPGVRWMLDELQEHVEPIDMANDHHTIRGLPPLLKYLSNSHANIRAKAAEVVSTIVQHNPKSQQLFMDANAMEPLLTNFTSDDDVTVRTKTNRSQRFRPNIIQDKQNVIWSHLPHQELNERPVCVSLALKEGFNLLLFVQELNERPVRVSWYAVLLALSWDVSLGRRDLLGFEATSLEIYGEDEYIPVTVVNSGMRDSDFANCELRSMVIVDKSLIFTSFIVYFFPCSGFFESTCVRSTSMLGTGTSTTDYPGRIPPGRDIQSATVDEKLANDMFVSGFT
ncbi:HSP70 nucleotide exchange factor FES1-like protein [Tanacetum coccineum]